MLNNSLNSSFNHIFSNRNLIGLFVLQHQTIATLYHGSAYKIASLIAKPFCQTSHGRRLCSLGEEFNRYCLRINETSTFRRNKTTPVGERSFKAVELRRKLKKTLEICVSGEKNEQKRVMQVSNQRTRYLG